MSTGRITEGMLGRRLLADLNLSTNLLGKYQRQISSGRRIEKPSDDALATHHALRLRAQLEGLSNDQRSISDAKGWLETTDAALGTIVDVAHRARELALQGANGVVSPSDRVKIAEEVDQLIEMAKSAGNASYGGRYVFSGTATTTAPYTPGAVDTYNGDTDNVFRQIGPGVTVAVNVTADGFLGNGGADGKLLSTLRSLSTHLRTGPVDAIRSSDLAALSANLEEVSTARGTIGALATRVEAAGERVAQTENATTSLLSETEDTDVAEALIQLTTQQTVYQAALKTGQSLVQPSLLDFLR